MGERHVSGRAGSLSLAEVFERCAFLLDGRVASPEAELKERSRLDVMPPFAGG
nr:MoaD/ThiS family protein [Rothia halotolerans]